MASIASILPDSEGWLPYWLLFIAIVSIFNTVQSYTTLKLTSQVYNAVASSLTPFAKDKSPKDVQVTALQSRTFGTWTLLASLVRLYGAYNLEEPAIYQLVIWTYVIGGAHFLSEWLVFRSANWGRGLAGPIITVIHREPRVREDAKEMEG